MKLQPISKTYYQINDDEVPVVPERNLIADVLYRAIRDILNTEYENTKNHRNAKTWMRIGFPVDVHDRHVPFTFYWCCLQLDLDPVVLRDIIEAMYRNGETILP